MIETAARWVWRLVALSFTLLPASAYACDVPASSSVIVGSFSPAALNAGAVPYTATGAGFSCASLNVLTLLSGNFLSATIPADSVLRLTSTTNPADTVGYRLFANASSAYELKPGGTTYYMNGAVLNLLNLGGDQGLNVQMFFKLPSGETVAPGIYTGTTPIRWSWNFCNGIAALGLCVGVTDAGSSTVLMRITLSVDAKPPIVSMAFNSTTWDPVNGTANPKAIPGSKRRMVMTLTNPDLVSTEANAIVIAIPTPNQSIIALDGDAASGGAVIRTSEGSIASGLTITYASPTSATDQVDFSSDGGSTFRFGPVAGNGTSEAAVTTVRITPLGSMAPLSSISVSIPYSVK